MDHKPIITQKHHESKEEEIEPDNIEIELNENKPSKENSIISKDEAFKNNKTF